MPDVSFKDLCIDVTAGDGRPAAVANFWATALDQPVVTHDDGEFHLGPPEGGSKSRTIWINNVPEPITGKSRAHIDVRVAGGDPAPLVAAGGTMERRTRRRDQLAHRQRSRRRGGVRVRPASGRPHRARSVRARRRRRRSTGHRRMVGGAHRRHGGRPRRARPIVWIEGAAGFPFMFWVFH